MARRHDRSNLSTTVARWFQTSQNLHRGRQRSRLLISRGATPASRVTEGPSVHSGRAGRAPAVDGAATGGMEPLDPLKERVKVHVEDRHQVRHGSVDTPPAAPALKPAARRHYHDDGRVRAPAVEGLSGVGPVDRGAHLRPGTSLLRALRSQRRRRRAGLWAAGGLSRRPRQGGRWGPSGDLPCPARAAGLRRPCCRAPSTGPNPPPPAPGPVENLRGAGRGPPPQLLSRRGAQGERRAWLLSRSDASLLLCPARRRPYPPLYLLLRPRRQWSRARPCRCSKGASVRGGSGRVGGGGGGQGVGAPVTPAERSS